MDALAPYLPLIGLAVVAFLALRFLAGLVRIALVLGVIALAVLFLTGGIG